MSPNVILNYAVSEPGQWTVAEIADDLGVPRAAVQKVVAWLRADGLIAEPFRDVRALRQRFPGTPARVPDRAAFAVWEMLRRASGPVTTIEIIAQAGVSESAVHRCVGTWRSRGAVSKKAGLWASQVAESSAVGPETGEPGGRAPTSDRGRRRAFDGAVPAGGSLSAHTAAESSGWSPGVGSGERCGLSDGGRDAP